jgi:hypothetical protein
MQFQPAVIANALRNRGIPNAREQLKKRQSGVHVFTAGGVMLIEWKDYTGTGESRLKDAVKELRELGFKMTWISDGLYKIDPAPPRVELSAEEIEAEREREEEKERDTYYETYGGEAYRQRYGAAAVEG